MYRYITVLLAALLLPAVGCAQPEAPQYVEGKHFERLPMPVRTSNPAKIEVVEVFWYGCGHCYSFEPMVSEWAKQLPDDVYFSTSPAMWNDLMRTHAQMHYTAKALGKLKALKQPLFTAMNVERKRLASEDEISDFFAGYGVEPDKFKKTFNSFGVRSQVNQADARARGYRITGTPEMVVNGKYRVSTRMAGSQGNMLKVVEFLVAKERASR